MFQNRFNTENIGNIPSGVRRWGRHRAVPSGVGEIDFRGDKPTVNSFPVTSPHWPLSCDSKGVVTVDEFRV